MEAMENRIRYVESRILTQNQPYNYRTATQVDAFQIRDAIRQKDLHVYVIPYCHRTLQPRKAVQLYGLHLQAYRTGLARALMHISPASVRCPDSCGGHGSASGTRWLNNRRVAVSIDLRDQEPFGVRRLTVSTALLTSSLSLSLAR
jgi:hypothetical protein